MIDARRDTAKCGGGLSEVSKGLEDPVARSVASLLFRGSMSLEGDVHATTGRGANWETGVCQ